MLVFIYFSQTVTQETSKQDQTISVNTLKNVCWENVLLIWSFMCEKKAFHVL